MQDEVTILENTVEDTPVGQPVRATDADEGANIVISIDSTKTKAYLQNNEVNPDIVNECVTRAYNHLARHVPVQNIR